ncbi:MAG: ROK family protein [Thermoguttaceae bacterium]|nr:ROK family protein [Thermoguttaceae bacterium]MDW8078812.1 ROK family protein [Thermoguttaceae bacterium]
MFLGIEIGGTKLQIAVGDGSGPPLTKLERLSVPGGADAAWIRSSIVPLASRFVAEFDVRAIGVGFGGPVDPVSGRVVRSHQVVGWEDFPLADWLAGQLARPVAVGNDADCAGLAEALLGGGKEHRYVFYTNVGSGIGGAIVIDGKVYTGSRGIAAEIGHLRPNWQVTDPAVDVETLASGWAIARAAREVLSRHGPHDLAVIDLWEACGGNPQNLTAREVAEAASRGCPQAQRILEEAIRVYGWAIAQAVTLLAPEVVVVGGGVSLIGEELFFRPLRKYVDEYVFPPLRGSFVIKPAALGEEVVVHGAILLAQQKAQGLM